MRRSRPKEYHGHHCAVSWVVPPTPARLRATSHWVTSTAALQVREARRWRRIGVVRWNGTFETTTAGGLVLSLDTDADGFTRRLIEAVVASSSAASPRLSQAVIAGSSASPPTSDPPRERGRPGPLIPRHTLPRRAIPWVAWSACAVRT